MMTISFNSRATALKDIPHLTNALVISFNDTLVEKEAIIDVFFKEDRGCSLLALVCKDDESDFSKTAAINIINAIAEAKRMGKEEIYIHCWAGISRSAAVAVWANRFLNLKIPRLDTYSIYNKHIYSTLRGVEIEGHPHNG